MSSERKFYRTVIQYEILSEEPIDDPISLEAIANECDEGGWSGQFLDTKHETLNATQTVKALIKQGSDPEFFNLNMDGEDTDE
jgi:hypothetical protein